MGDIACYTGEKHFSTPAEEPTMTVKEKDALFLELFERHRALVTRVVARTLSGSGCVQDVPDVLQETFIKCRRNFDPEKNVNFGQWAAESAKRNALDVLRKRSRRGRYLADHVVATDEGVMSLLELCPDGSGTPESLLAEAQERAAAEQFVRNGLERLSLAIRTTLRLRYLDELPIKEIARATRTNENTVKTRVRYGLKHLRRRAA
jgi:RNA polymerase sigma factor (sigma-70 family)